MNMQLFWNRIIRYSFVFLLLAWVFPAKTSAADVDQEARPVLIIFHSPSCHACVEAKQKVLPGLESEFKDKVIFEYRDIGETDNYKMLIGLLQKRGADLKFQVPLFYFNGRILKSDAHLKDNLRGFILKGLKGKPSVLEEVSTDLVAYFKSFAPAAIIIAGLQDGINPCAFTVIVFFISFLGVQGYRKRELILIGSAFIFTVFLTYLCIGLGIFNFLYRFKGFWLVTSLVNSMVGMLSILFGFFALYDFIKFKRTGSTEGLILQLPKPVKESIHRVIGFFHRRNAQDKQNNSLPGLSKLIFSAIASGFLVSLLEAVCTGQVYLPTISFVLKTTPLKLQALGYLLMYNIMFIIPLIVIFVFALFGTTNLQFSGFLKKHLGFGISFDVQYYVYHSANCDFCLCSVWYN